MEENQNNENIKPRKKVNPFNVFRIHEVTAENDIKFRGKLSYRHLRIIAWAFLIIAQIGVLLALAGNLRGNDNMFGPAPTILKFFSNLMSPLFLIAAFSVVLVAKDGYRRLIILYGGLSVFMYLAFLLFYQHYFVGIVDIIAPESSQELAGNLAYLLSGHGYIAFNIFLDLFLCTMATCFINYKPKKYFQGKKLIIFRLFALLPILYEVGSIFLKMLASTGVTPISPFLFPLLTTKAPVAFLVFVCMALFVKVRERRFLKRGKTIEDYQEFQNSNVNSLQFSLFLSFIIVIAVVIDVILLGILTGVLAGNTVVEGVPEDEIFSYCLNTVYGWGFGQTAMMIFIIPLIIFFDYRKTYSNKLVDLLVPVVGIFLIVAVLFEGGFLVLRDYLISARNKAQEAENAIALIGNIFKKKH